MKRRNFLVNFILGLLSFTFGYKVGTAHSEETELVQNTTHSDKGLAAQAKDLEERGFNIQLNSSLAKNNDWSKALTIALEHLGDGGTIFFPYGQYVIDDSIEVKYDDFTFKGDGELILKEGFKISANNFYAYGLRLRAKEYSTSCQGFRITPPTKNDINKITIENCHFEGFFYSTNFMGRPYSLDEPDKEFGVYDTSIINCTSVAPKGKNAGHFQHIGVTRPLISNCRTFGGQNSTSYNFIADNKDIIISNCYDHDNSYGSCEIENLCKGATLSNNLFKKQLWIDDSSDIVITGGSYEKIYITTQHHDTVNINVSGTFVKTIQIEQFGSPTAQDLPKRIKGVKLSNIIIGDSNYDYGLLIQGNTNGNPRVQDVEIQNLSFTERSKSNKIGIVRGKELDIIASGNKVHGDVVITGEGGKIDWSNNIKASFPHGGHDSLLKSNLFSSPKDALNVSGMYVYESERVNINPSASISANFNVRKLPQYSARLYRLFLTCRDTANNVFSSIEQEILLSNPFGNVEVSYGKIKKLLDNHAANVTIKASLSNDDLEILITNHNNQPLAIMLELIEHNMIE